MKKMLCKLTYFLLLISGLCMGTPVYAQNTPAEPIPANKTVHPEKFYGPSSFPEGIKLSDIPVDDDDNSRISILQATNPVEAVDEYNFNIKTAATTDKVADMRVYSVASGGSSSLNISGHSFLSIKNISPKKIYIGDLLVNSGHSVTIGTWGNKNEHEGLWYNLEGYLAYMENVYSSNISMHVYLTQTLLNNVNTNIKQNDNWSLTNNCSSFAARIWNSVCSNKISAGTPNTPANLAKSIKSHKTKYGTNKPVPYDFGVYYGYPSKVSSEFAGFTDGN